MYSVGYVVLWVAATTLPLWKYHRELHGVNAAQAGLALFNSINLIICIWELSLYYHRRFIKTHYTTMKQHLPRGRLPQPMFLFEHATLLEVLQLKYWGKVWSTYSLMDPSYSDSTTFGFWIDVGNGHVTMIPTVLFALGLTWDILPARILGMIGLVLNWQMMYGTVLYFLSYFHNERWKGRPGLPIVIVANTIWILGPLYGMYVSYDMIMTDSYRLVRS